MTRGVKSPPGRLGATADYDASMGAPQGDERPHTSATDRDISPDRDGTVIVLPDVVEFAWAPFYLEPPD